MTKATSLMKCVLHHRYERAEAENELAKLEETQRRKVEAEKLKSGQVQGDPMEEAEAAAMAGR